MSDSEFHSLNNNMKAQMISESGIHLTSIDYYGYRSSLYSVGIDFFEIALNPLTGGVQSVDLVEVSHLDKYINKINLEM